MALNVTTAVFGENCNTATASPSLAQWDKGQVLQISGVDLPDAYQVEFSTVYTRNAIPVIGNASGVQVPNELLQRSAPITACVVLHSTANSRDTEYWVTIHITPRKPPETITPDPEQQDVIDQAIAALQDGTARAEAAATAAAGSATAADGSAENAEAWAVGQRAGEDVPDTDPTYHNNSKYYAGAAEAAAEEAGQHEASWESWVRRAETAADDAEGSARAAAGSKADAETAAQTATQKATEAGNSAAAASGSASEARQTVDGAIGAINTAKGGALTAIGSAGSNAVGAVNQAGTTQTERVTTEGNTQVNRVQEKGDEVIGSIPQDYTDLVDDVADLSRQLSDLDSRIIERVVFNGTSSVCAVDAITLSQNGDSLEIEVFPEVGTASSGYSFASSANKTRISIGATTKGVAFRAADETWLYIGNDAFVNEKNHYIINIQYEDDNIKFFVDGELLNTYTGQKPITITGFGKNNYWSYWKGQIGYIKYNGVKYKTISALAGYSEIDVETLLPFGFLTAEQNKAIKESNKKITIEPTNTAVNVYIPLTTTIYGKIVIGFESDHADANYIDYWRINDSGLYTSQDGVNFTRISGSLLVGAENEMAIAFQGMGDYSGGYHGDERIDLGSNCYIKFIVDGAEYGISEIVNLGTIQCETFGYREVSEIFASYSYNANHLKVADHTKITEFSLSGFKTTNYICMELSNFDKESLKVITTFTGLLCIANTFANKVISDVGIEYIANHPVSTTVLATDIDKYSRVAKCLNGNYSCKMDSKLLHTNISGYSDPAILVEFYDRQQDVKYYSYLPANVDVQTGDYFATECSVDWYMATD